MGLRAFLPDPISVSNVFQSYRFKYQIIWFESISWNKWHSTVTFGVVNQSRPVHPDISDTAAVEQDESDNQSAIEGRHCRPLRISQPVDSHWRTLGIARCAGRLLANCKTASSAIPSVGKRTTRRLERRVGHQGDRTALCHVFVH